MYGDKKNLIDQKEYDLDKQITVRSLSKKLLLSTITKEQCKILLDWLDNEDNLFIFFMALNDSRFQNKIINDQTFSIVTEIFKKALEKMCKKHNKKIERFIVIMSDSFYKVEKDNQAYISAEIKDHKLFTNKIFWENFSEYEVNEATINMKIKKIKKLLQ